MLQLLVLGGYLEMVAHQIVCTQEETSIEETERTHTTTNNHYNVRRCRSLVQDAQCHTKVRVHTPF